MLGGQDELDLRRRLLRHECAGEVVQRAPPFNEELYAVDIDLIDDQAVPRPGHIEPELSEEASVYSALVLGVRDYVSKHRFPGIVLGLSGGIDSALDAGDRRRCARRRSRARSDDAVTLYVADESRRCRAGKRERSASATT